MPLERRRVITVDHHVTLHPPAVPPAASTSVDLLPMTMTFNSTNRFRFHFWDLDRKAANWILVNDESEFYASFVVMSHR
jgi:hypothetical protein